MEKKSEPTIKQQYKKYKTLSLAFSGGEYVSAALPYGIMAIVNRHEWFVYNPEPWRIGLGGSIGLVLLALAMFLITKRKENSNLSNGMISLLIGWYAITFVFFLLAQINMEIYKIMAYGGFGLIGALGLEIGSKQFNKKANELEQAMKNAKNNLQTEQATKEIQEEEKKKVKIKVIK